MNDIYSLGEYGSTFRLTKESSYKLMTAIVQCNAAIICCGVDSTCPPTHIYMRLELNAPNAVKFGSIIGVKLDKVESAGGKSLFYSHT